jgi:iron complex transport system substrate-binding protein
MEERLMRQQLHRLLKLFLLGIFTFALVCACKDNSPRQVSPGSINTSNQAVRVVEHAMGTSEVPVIPQRVVVLDTAPLDTALALSIQPIGTYIWETFPQYLEESVENVQDIAIVGNGNQPSLEKILQLKPDLILGSKLGSSPQQYQLLSQIAPTVFTEGSGRQTDWQQNFQLYAEALGQAEFAKQLLERYQQRVQQLRQKIPRPQTIVISVLSSYNNQLDTYTKGTFSGSILQDIGFSRPTVQDTTTYEINLSGEVLDELDGDYIFLIYDLRPDEISKKELTANPLWSQLEAVRQDRVCEVTGEVWAAGRSLLAANQILTDVEMCLTQRH